MARKKHSGNGEGSVVTVKRTGRVVGYRAQLTIGWADGKQQRKTGTLHKTKAEARDELHLLKQQHAQGVNLAAPAQTLGPFLTMWVEDIFAQRGAPKTVADYRGVVKRLNAEFGEKPLGKLTGQQIQAYFTLLGKEGKVTLRDGVEHRTGLSPSSLRQIYTVLHSGLEQAVKWKILPYNPATHITLPKVGRSNAQTLTPAEARTLLDAARGERLELALRLMLALGLRRGEVCGLRWDTIDVDKGAILISGSLGYVNGEGLHYGPPKTKSGYRRIKLPAALLASLRWHQTRQEAERKAMGDKWQQDCPYVFVSPQDGGPLNSGAVYTTFKAVAARAGLSPAFTPHTLRHSCASFLYAEGATDKTVSAFLGHATTQITRDLYIHLLGGELDDAAERLTDLLDRGDVSDQQRKQG